MRSVPVTIGVLIALILQGASIRAENTGKLAIFHAGSLAVPFREVTAAFNKKYPNVTVNAEAGGSRDSARKISDLGRPCDVFGSADYEVVEELLMPKFADFNIRFATNELAIAYTNKSRFHDKINAKNWHEILLRDDVAFGRADPNRDPCGYRTLMVFQLAEKQYRRPGLAEKLAKKDGDRFIRPKETDLLALLESGEIDYLLIYRSVCVQHKLNVVRLPDAVNLGSTKLAGIYKQAKVKISGKSPGEFTNVIGAPIAYSVTIPKNAENREMAEAWVALLLGPQGRRIMEKSGQSVIAPAKVDHPNKLPASLKPFCTP